MTVGVALRLLSVMVLWASCFPLITIGLDLAPHLAFAAMRAALAGLCLVAFGAVFKRPVPRGARSWALVALVGLGATSLGFLGMFHAAEFVSPGLATVIANTQPLLAAILAHVFLQERLTVLGKTGLMAGFAGIGAIAWPGLADGDIQGYTLGIVYVVLAATGVSIGNIAIKRLTGQVDAVMAMGLQLLIGAAPLALLSMLTEDVSSLTWSADFALVLVVLAVFGSSLAFWLWFAALEQVDLNRANSFTFLVPIFALAIGAALFEERLAWIQVAGVVLVLAGIVLVQRDAPERTRR
jgi:drug/metabolite transporter (DMT)-like permease